MTFLRRAVRAMRLDAGVFEEVEADRSATLQAVAVILLSGVAAAIGAIDVAFDGPVPELETATIRLDASIMIRDLLLALAGWVTWAIVTMTVGVHLLPERTTRADTGQLFRTLGFAAAPGVIRVLGIVPPLRGAVFVLAAVWMLAAMVVAVRQALDYTSTMRAIAVCLVGWILMVVLVLTVGWFLAPTVQ